MTHFGPTQTFGQIETLKKGTFGPKIDFLGQDKIIIHCNIKYSSIEFHMHRAECHNREPNRHLGNIATADPLRLVRSTSNSINLNHSNESLNGSLTS